MLKKKLSDIAELYSGLSYRRYLNEDGEKFNVIVQRSIKGDGELSDFEEVHLKTPIKQRFFTQPGDVLMKLTYPFDVVEVKTPGLVVSDRIAIIRFDNTYDPTFFAHLLTNAHVKKQLHQVGSTERVAHASLKELKEIELIIPDLKTQVKYGELLDTINQKLHHDQRVVEYDRRLKEGIMNELWGDIDE